MVHDKLFNATMLDYMKSFEKHINKSTAPWIASDIPCSKLHYNKIAFHHILLSCEDHSKRHIHLVMIELDLVLMNLT